MNFFEMFETFENFGIFALEILDFRNLKDFSWKCLRNFENEVRKYCKAKKCYWLLQDDKYFKDFGGKKNDKKTKKNYYMSAALAS